MKSNKCSIVKLAGISIALRDVWITCATCATCALWGIRGIWGMEDF